MARISLSVAFVLSIACGDVGSSGPPTDAGSQDGADTGDGALPLDAGAHADAQPTDGASVDGGSDSGVPRDAAVIDGSLAGTTLEGLVVSWPEALELCEHWLEGGTLALAVDQKVHLTLPPQVRTSLDPGSLTAATIVGGDVERGPFAAAQWQLPRVGSASTLTEWSLSGPPNQNTLNVEIVHDLGPAGALFEALTITRARGDRRPVVYRADASSETTFFYQPLGGTRQLLERCGGPEGLERAVVVLSAFRGSDSVTLIREQATRLSPAGSAPVYPTRGELLLSNQAAYAEAFLAAGVWSQVYTAEHHNWSERALVRFDHDRRWHHLVYGPLARGEMPSDPMTMPKTVELTNANTPGVKPTLALTSLALPSGVESTVSYDVEVDWKRVDEVDLLRELTARGCATARVITLWSPTALGTYLFQLGICPAGGTVTDLALFVPIYFPPDPHLVGTRYTQISPATVDGFAGVEIDLGAFFVQLASPGAYRTKILDASRTVLETTNAYESTLFETGFSSGSRETHSGADASTSVVATLVRQWVGQGAGNSGIFAPVSFELSFAGTDHRVVAWDRLNYVNTHHNWDDTLVAEDDELRMFWTVLGFGGDYQVRAERLSDGIEVLAPTIIR